MWKGFFAASALSTLLFAVDMPRAGAKPADLPYQHQIECDETGDPPAQGKWQIELDITGNGIALKLGAGLARPEETPAIDAVLPAYVEQWLWHLGDMFTQPSRAATWQAIGNLFPFTRVWQGMAPGAASSEVHPPSDLGDSCERTIPLGLVELWY